MQNVARSSPERQSRMPLPAEERARRQVSSELLPVIAELLFRCDKGNKYAKFSQLSDAAQTVYLAEALQLTSIDKRTERLHQVHSVDAHVFAVRADEQETVMRQAREDIARYEVASHFGAIRPGYCLICKGRITPADAYVLELSATLKADVHGSCCAKDARFQLMSSFSFRLIGELR